MPITRFASVVLLPLVTACMPDESLTAYGAAGTVWTLQSLDGEPFPAHATVAFPAPGQIAGQAPCNRYSGTQTAPYPWFETGPLAATRMACPDLSAEAEFLSALSEMTQAEVVGDILILRDDAGRDMVFSAVPPN